MTRLLLAVSASVLVAVGVLAPAAPARADTVDDGTPGLLTLDIDPGVLDLELDPGERDYWLIAPHLEAPGDGSLELRFDGSGVLAPVLSLAVDECSVPWTTVPAHTTPPSCAGTLTPLVAPASVTSLAGQQTVLGQIGDGESRWLSVTVALADPIASEMQGESADFRLTFIAAGDSEDITPNPVRPPETAQTGISFVAPLALALALALGGAVLRVLPDRRRKDAA